MTNTIIIPKLLSVSVSGSVVSGRVRIARYTNFGNTLITTPTSPQKLHVRIYCVARGRGEDTSKDYYITFAGRPKEFSFEIKCKPGDYSLYASIINGYSQTISDMRFITIKEPSKPKPAPSPKPQPTLNWNLINSLSDLTSYRISYIDSRGVLTHEEHLGIEIKGLAKAGKIKKVISIVKIPSRPVYEHVEHHNGITSITLTHTPQPGFKKVTKTPHVTVKLLPKPQQKLSKAVTPTSSKPSVVSKTIPKPQQKPTPTQSVVPNQVHEIAESQPEQKKTIPSWVIPVGVLVGLYIISRRR
ncbi:hypothetical protein [Thermococcus nautili]|uniref:hypothetical protein n=1 Tax=Thermococcus nautili TaxID=195522 RepID=UPI0025537EF1|nr:hypothetical protein [Thermococcus nautili]